MGNPKQKWTADEEEALKNGIKKYGPGKWKFIQRDPDFNKFLHSRSNIDLKDKWRNMSAAAGQGSREKSRTPKPKLPESTSVSNLACLTSAPSLPVSNESNVDLIKEDPSKDAKNRFNVLVIEALSSTKQPNGLDITALMSYIETTSKLNKLGAPKLIHSSSLCNFSVNLELHTTKQRVDEVPQNFRKLLGSRLRRLVGRDDIEKIDNCYRIKDASLPLPKPATTTTTIQETQPIQKLQPTLSPCVSRETFRKAATLAALSLAKGEDLNYQVAEAIREVEFIAKMTEEEEDILKLAKEICEICTQGKTVPIR